MSSLAAYRGRHAGAMIVVCGCGRSLLDLGEPRRFTTIGVNDVGRLFDPTYLVVVNPRSQFRNDRFRYVETSRAQVLFTQLELGRVAPPVVRFRLGRYAGTGIGAGETLDYTQNSPYVAVCLAAYMGAARIGLIGVDLTDDHFFAATGRHALAGRSREIDEQYGRLAMALAARGVELVNLSAASRLVSLARARMDGPEGWTVVAAARPVAPARVATTPRIVTPPRVAAPRRVVTTPGIAPPPRLVARVRAVTPPRTAAPPPGVAARRPLVVPRAAPLSRVVAPPRLAARGRR
jgi:hypothetical protein